MSIRALQSIYGATAFHVKPSFMSTSSRALSVARSVRTTSTSPSTRYVRLYSSSAQNQVRKRSFQILFSCVLGFGIGVGSGVWWAVVPTPGSGTTHSENVDPEASTNTLENLITSRLSSEARIHFDDFATSHSTRVASSSPCEDHLVRGQLCALGELSQHPWHAWGVFDGHAGWQTAELLTKRLLPAVQSALGTLAVGSTDEVLDATIKDAFVALDDSIVRGAVETLKSGVRYNEKVAKLMPAYSGSCALLSLLDPTRWTLKVACVGDSRAVLGEITPDGRWVARALSVDQTGSNEDETSRINAEHPGEGGIVKDGRVLGLMVSRGFGDGRWKWSLDEQKEIKEDFDGYSPLAPGKYSVKTPPYLTAEPVITTTKLDQARPSFLIMGSDGFWDRVSNEQAVNLVDLWLQTRTTDGGPRNKPTTNRPLATGQVEYEDFQIVKHRQGGTGFQFTEGRTVIQDDNAAVHLVRNALGGNFQEMIAANMMVEPPFSRDMRDDITVQVIFFDPSKSKR